MDPGDIITKTGAAIGALLGIFNTWHGWRSRNVNLKVIPISVTVKYEERADSGSVITKPYVAPGVKIVNLSSFAVTLEEVGYELQDGQQYALSRIDSVGRISGGMYAPDKLLRQIQPRGSLRMLGKSSDESNLNNKRIHKVYARTACGTTQRKRNKEIKRISSLLENGQPVVQQFEQLS